MRPELVGRMAATLLAVLAVNALLVVLAASLLWPWLSTLGGPPGPAVAAVALAVALAAVAWAQVGYARRQLLDAVDATPATPTSHPDLHARQTRLATAANCPRPTLAVVDSPVENSMAVGGPRSATVVLSEGLLATLDGEQLDAVLAHEIAHVRNRDAAVLTLASFLPALAADEYEPLADRVSPAAVGVAVVVLAAVGLVVLDPPGVGPGAVGAVALLVAGSALFGSAALGVLAAPVLLFARRLSRDRELVADRAAAHLTGGPAALATALQQLSDAPEPPDEDARRAGPPPVGSTPESSATVRGLCLLPHGFDGRPGDWEGLLSTRAHPPVEQRVERLRDLAAEMER